MTDRIKIVQAVEWKSASIADRSGLGLAKTHAAPVEAIVKGDDGEPLARTLGWTMSTEARDRDRDRISLKGWDLKNFKKNPVVPWAHNYAELPVAKCTNVLVDKEKGRLWGAKQFPTREQHPFGNMVFELSRDGYLNTASVGFIPLDYVPDEPTDKDVEGARLGYFHKKQELLESSIVVVPSNPTALQSAKSVHGIDLTPYVPFAEKILDGEKGAGLWVARKSVEELFALVSPPQPFVVVPAALEPERGVVVVAGPDATVDNVITADVYEGTVLQLGVNTAPALILSDEVKALVAVEIKTAVLAALKDLGITPAPVQAPAANVEPIAEVPAVEAAAPATTPAVEAQEAAPAPIAEPEATLPEANQEQTYVLSGDEPRAADADNNTETEQVLVDPDVLRDALRDVFGAPSR